MSKETGTIIAIGDIQTFANDFQKREVVLKTEENPQYPQEIPVEVLKNRFDILNGINVGDKVEFDLNLRGSEYNGRRYVNVQGWRLTVLEKGAGATITPKATSNPFPDAPVEPQAEEPDVEDDLPF